MDKRKACLAAAAALSLSLSTGFAAGDGTYAATAKGFGGDVTVTLSIQDGELIDVTAEGASETDGVGSRAIELMPGAMLAGNTVETDGVSGATVTSTAILEAAKAALAESGVTLTAQQADIEQHMTPGTYTGEAYGKWKKGSIEGERFGSPAIIQPTQVAVTVDETSILKVEVLEILDTLVAQINTQQMGIPLGNLLLPDLLAGTGPELPVKAVSLTMSNADFFSDFTAAGINQTLQTLKVKFTISLTILTTVGYETVDVDSDVMVAQTVIVGTVPETYVNLGHLTTTEGWDQYGTETGD